MRRRPRSGRSRMVQMSISVPRFVHDELETYRKKLGIGMSELVRRIVTDAVLRKREEGQP